MSDMSSKSSKDANYEMLQTLMIMAFVAYVWTMTEEWFRENRPGMSKITRHLWSHLITTVICIGMLFALFGTLFGLVVMWGG